MKELETGENQGQGCSLEGNYKCPEERWQEPDPLWGNEENVLLWGSGKF